MVEYSYKEALDLLNKNLNVCLLFFQFASLTLHFPNNQSAEKQFQSVESDVAYIKDQITTTEVNVARCHNYRVELRKVQQQQRPAGAVAAAAALAGPGAGAGRALEAP